MPIPTGTRREFIQTTAAAAAAFTIVPRHVLGGQKFVAPSDKVNVAIIGAGGQGRTNARALFQEEDCQIIALADPAEEWDLAKWYYGGKSGRGPVKDEVEKHYAAKTPNHKCAVYEDFRVMLEKEPAIDAVLIATPDHLHAFISILAMKAGKHVYCEKPLTHNIREARLVARVAKETGVATQMGNHGRSGEGHRQTIEWIKDGAIGAVREVHAWSGTPRTAKAVWPGEGPATKPAGLNWDLWLGPRADRPYSGKVAPFVWRWVWDFGNGTMPDMSPHHFDPAFNALGLDAPDHHRRPDVLRRSRRDDRQQPDHLPVCGEGRPRPADRVLVRQRPQAGACRSRSTPTIRGSASATANDGLMLVGEKGMITCAGWSGMPRLLPMELHRSYTRPAKTLPRVAGHHADWLQACKGGTPACSNFDYGARLTEFVLLGALALRTGKVLKWDAEGMKAANVPEAQPFIDGSYRKGWELPA